MECRRALNLKACNCTYPCERRGLCCECVAYHRKRNELPACYFDKDAEKSYDRSIERFMQG
ncbi:MAG: DUF6485 family protein [Candidatus Altiarchaeota archaeon]